MDALWFTLLLFKHVPRSAESGWLIAGRLCGNVLLSVIERKNFWFGLFSITSAERCAVSKALAVGGSFEVPKIESRFFLLLLF